jgi:hypothetical protein
MRKQQQGMTTIGLIILVAFIGFVGFGVLQMIPVYLENMKVQQVLNQTKESLDNQNTSVVAIRSALDKSADIEGLYDINVKKDFKISRTAQGYVVRIDYQREKAFLANVYLVAKFDHEVEILR